MKYKVFLSIEKYKIVMRSVNQSTQNVGERSTIVVCKVIDKNITLFLHILFNIHVGYVNILSFIKKTEMSF